MVNELGTFINGSNSGFKISIFTSPNSVLVITGGLFLFLGSFVASKISNGLSKISFRLSKGSGGIITKKGVGNTLRIVVSDVIFNVLGDSGTSGELDSAKGIVVTLTVVQ